MRASSERRGCFGFRSRACYRPRTSSDRQESIRGNSARKYPKFQYYRAYRPRQVDARRRSEEHTSELQSLMRISYAVFCLKKKKITTLNISITSSQQNSNRRNPTTQQSTCQTYYKH